jgi:hypothetical protein
MAHAGGAPSKLTKEQKAELLVAFRAYIERTPDPTVVGFCAFDPVPAKLFVTRHNLNDWDEFSTLQKYCIEKQEAYLLQAGGTGRYNPTMAIFRLKQPQHGYTDRQDVNTQGEVKHSYEELDDKQLEAAIKAREARISEAA